MNILLIGKRCTSYKIKLILYIKYSIKVIPGTKFVLYILYLKDQCKIKSYIFNNSL